MASSQSYDTSQFNLAATGERQPGSSFKPFVLTTAVDQGIDPDHDLLPAPSTITLTPPGSEPWTVPAAWAARSRSRDATANSVNTVFAQLGLDVGPENFDEMAHKMGITSELQGVQAEALGGTSTCCTVLEMSMPTRRSPTAASTTTRPRSPRSSSRTARSTSPRTARARG